MLIIFSHRKALHTAKSQGDGVRVVQACYSLEIAYTLLLDYAKAIECHLLHLQIAQELTETIGEGRIAPIALNNACLGSHEQTLHLASKQLELSKQIRNEFVNKHCI